MLTLRSLCGIQIWFETICRYLTYRSFGTSEIHIMRLYI